MTAGTPRKKVGRGYERDLDAGPFRPMTDSFDLHLRAERKSPKTIRVYVDAVLWFAAAYVIPAGLSDWSEVKARHVQQWVTTLLADYSDSYANNQFRALQQFFKWYATEDPDEPRPNAMANLRPPKIGDKLVPVISDDELNALLARAQGLTGVRRPQSSAIPQLLLGLKVSGVISCLASVHRVNRVPFGPFDGKSAF